MEHFAVFFVHSIFLLYICSVKRFIVIAEEGDLIGEKKLIGQYLREECLADWQVVVSGVGAANVIRTLRELPRDAEILNVGYAGSSNFPIGSLVAVSEVRLNHPNCTYPEPAMPLDIVPEEWLRRKPDYCAIDYSGADFVLASDYKDCTFDMELAYMAAFGFKKLYALKIVSDNLSLHDYRQVAAGVE